MIVPPYPSHRVLQMKYNQIKNNVVHYYDTFWKFYLWIFWGLIFDPGILGGFVGCPRDFSGF